jgi:hypothetical protein
MTHLSSPSRRLKCGMTNVKTPAEKELSDAVLAERHRVQSLHALRFRHDPDHKRVPEARFLRFVNDPTQNERTFAQYLVSKGLATDQTATPAANPTEAADETARLASLNFIRTEYQEDHPWITDQEFETFTDDPTKTPDEFREYLARKNPRD